MIRQALSGAIAALILVGCASLPVVAVPASPSPSGAASAAPDAMATAKPSVDPFAPAPPTEWTFGKVTAKSSPIEAQIIYPLGADPSKLVYGTAQSFYLTVDGLVYQVRYDRADAFALVKVGDTVNLHPSELRSCVKGGECHVMFYVARGSHAVPPLLRP